MKDFAEQAAILANLKARAGKSSGVSLQVVGQDGTTPLLYAVQSGTVMNGVFVEASDGEIEARLRDDHRVSEVAIPNDMVERRKFLAAWSERARMAAKKGLGMSVLLLPLAACGGGGGGGSTSSTKGFVIDGYIANGFIFRDENGNGVFDLGEPNTRTGADGSFTLGGDISKPIIMDGSVPGAIDLDNPSVPFTGILTAPAGSTVVTPLTTLIQQLIAADETLTVAAAQDAVKSALGISSDADLTATDPIASDNLVFRV